MFGLSFGEVLIVMVVALLVLGPERLPKVARSIGKGLREVRRTTGSFREVLEEELYLGDDEPAKPAKPAAAGGAVARAPALAPEDAEETETPDDAPAPVARTPTPLAPAGAEMTAGGDEAPATVARTPTPLAPASQAPSEGAEVEPGEEAGEATEAKAEGKQR